MKKTILISLLGLVLVSGMVTGLYLLNQQTNPSSSAFSENVTPIPTPLFLEVKEKKEIKPTKEPTPTLNALYEKCKEGFGQRKGDAGFDEVCDKNKNERIDVFDLKDIL